MKGQRVLLWTGGQPGGAAGCEGMAEKLPLLPAPTPLRRGALIEYQWGQSHFEIVASACSLRTTPWGSGQMTWLHCKAMRTAEVKADEPTGLMNVLLPAAYVTAVGPGPTFQIARHGRTEDLGVFPPNQPAPVDALSVAEIEQILAELWVSERN
jgi:hypothetical protein